MTDEGRKESGSKFAIIGTTETAELAPFSDPSWTIINVGPNIAPFQHNLSWRWDEWFECHELSTWPADKDHAFYLTEVLQKMTPDQTLWVFDDDFHSPAAKPFPYRELQQKYGKRWFRNSIAWVAAHCIERGATDIAFWGCDLESDVEREQEAWGVMHFIDLARLIGINIHGPKGSGLFRQQESYPFRTTNPTYMALVKREKILRSRRATFIAASEKVDDDDAKHLMAEELALVDGALNEIELMKRHI